MKKKRFDELLESAEEAVAIAEGKAKPARVHHATPEQNAIDDGQPLEISKTKPK